MQTILKIIGLAIVHLIAIFTVTYCALTLAWVIDFIVQKDYENQTFVATVALKVTMYSIGLFAGIKALTIPYSKCLTKKTT